MLSGVDLPRFSDDNKPKSFTMTLSRALTYKKRVVERLNQIEKDIIEYNSIIVGNQREVKIETLIIERARVINHMINLKLKIQRKTDPIREVIFGLSELKAENDFFRKIPTTHGPVVNPKVSLEDKISYESIIKRKDIDSRIRENNAKIDAAQETIDQHNHITTVTIEDIGILT